MFKPLKKFVKKNSTTSLALATIAISLSVGLSIPSAINPNISQICFDWDVNCTQTRATKEKAKQAATTRKTTPNPPTPTRPDPEDLLPENEFYVPPATTPAPPKSDGCREGERRCYGGKNQFCAPLPNNQGTEWISLGGSCDPSKPLTNYTTQTTTAETQEEDENYGVPKCNPTCKAPYVCTWQTGNSTTCILEQFTCVDENTGGNYKNGVPLYLPGPSDPYCNSYKTGANSGYEFISRTCVNGQWKTSYSKNPTSNCPDTGGCRSYTSSEEFQFNNCCEIMKNQSDWGQYESMCKGQSQIDNSDSNHSVIEKAKGFFDAILSIFGLKRT